MELSKIFHYAVVATSLFISFIVTEGILMLVVFYLGTFLSFIILVIIFSLVSISVSNFISTNETFFIRDCSLEKKLRIWFTSKKYHLSPFVIKLSKISKFLAISISSFLFGPILTLVLVKYLGYKNLSIYSLCVISSVIFSGSWTLIYGGGIRIVSGLLF